MADKTLTQLTSATSVALADKLYLVQGNNSRQATVQQVKNALGSDTAASISVDQTNLQVVSGATVQAWVESADTALLNARSTGIRFGGDAVAATGLNVNISVGAGQIWTTPILPLRCLRKYRGMLRLSQLPTPA